MSDLEKAVLFLYENQGFDFDDVRDAIVRMFGPGCSATIHDGDGVTLSIGVDGYYCAGTIDNQNGQRVASFAIDYVAEETPDGDFRRHVLGIHIGQPGEWCRNESDAVAFELWKSWVARIYGTARP